MSSASSVGTCAVCLRTGLSIVSATGLLWRHGPRDNPCAGTGSLPVIGSVQARAASSAPTASTPLVTDDTFVDIFDTSVAGPSITFCHPEISTPILKRIPKGARIQASNLLCRLLREILNNPYNLPAWNRLFGFASGCFSRPKRGGRSSNLTTLVLRQVQKFESGGDQSFKEKNLSRLQET